MLLRMMMCLVLLWQVSANASQDDKTEVIKAEIQQLQRLIKSYNLDLKIKLTEKVADSAKQLVVLDAGFQKSLSPRSFSSAFATVVKCDDGDTVVVPDPDRGHGPGRGGHHDDDRTTCTPYCSSRWADGSCSSWGADKCGENITCSPYCSSRWADGSCSSWGADVCN